MTTFTPESIPKINDWLKYISIPQLNLNLIDSSTILGKIIKDSYKTDPYNTIKMIHDCYRDNPFLTEEVISHHNLKLILKCNPLEP